MQKEGGYSVKIIGISVQVYEPDYKRNECYVEVNKEVVDVVKETPKQYKIEGAGFVFNCLSNISKSDIGKIQHRDYSFVMERKVWLLDDENFNEKETTNILKNALLNKIDKQILKYKELRKALSFK